MKSKRGFASMSKEKHALIASKGGKTAHARGVAHKWTPEQARLAGIKGGRNRAIKAKAQLQADAE